ncbi:PREDICTED: basic proline-rich protein-like [Cercocebus atys]|uniref:basic proline-rich protein-like n=1 Tax=Cercocebus atys TaxID=9531 RepID=UPI0005F4003D|nr:PREDICTED: basic proline-rich protein-like [Cercocebus atys]
MVIFVMTSTQPPPSRRAVAVSVISFRPAGRRRPPALVSSGPDGACALKGCPALSPAFPGLEPAEPQRGRRGVPGPCSPAPPGSARGGAGPGQRAGPSALPRAVTWARAPQVPGPQPCGTDSHRSSGGIEVVAGPPPAVRRRTHLPDLRRQVRLGGTSPASSYTCANASGSAGQTQQLVPCVKNAAMDCDGTLENKELTHIAFWYIKMKCKEPKIT